MVDHSQLSRSHGFGNDVRWLANRQNNWIPHHSPPPARWRLFGRDGRGNHDWACNYRKGPNIDNACHRRSRLRGWRYARMARCSVDLGREDCCRMGPDFSRRRTYRSGWICLRTLRNPAIHSLVRRGFSSGLLKIACSPHGLRNDLNNHPFRTCQLDQIAGLL
jgi:hypothetical protein